MSLTRFQTLLVRGLTYFRRIESMKMETVIRSPQKGVIAKLVHKEGVFRLLRARCGIC